MEMQDMNSNSKPPHPKSIIELFDSHGEFAAYLNGKSEEFINGSHEVRGYHIKIYFTDIAVFFRWSITPMLSKSKYLA